MKVAFTYPRAGRKKSCTARLACTSDTFLGSLGLSAGEPRAVEVKVPLSLSIRSVELTALPELGRSGDLKYSYWPTISDSTYSPLTPPSKSKTDMPISACVAGAKKRGEKAPAGAAGVACEACEANQGDMVLCAWRWRAPSMEHRRR